MVRPGFKLGTPAQETASVPLAVFSSGDSTLGALSRVFERSGWYLCKGSGLTGKPVRTFKIYETLSVCFILGSHENIPLNPG